MAKYLLPIQAGSGIDANLSRQKAHWLTENTLAWDIEPLPGGEYALHYAPDGGLAVAGGDHRRADDPAGPGRERPARTSSRRSGRTSPTTRRSASRPATSTRSPRR